MVTGGGTSPLRRLRAGKLSAATSFQAISNGFAISAEYAQLKLKLPGDFAAALHYRLCSEPSPVSCCLVHCHRRLRRRLILVSENICNGGREQIELPEALQLPLAIHPDHAVRHYSSLDRHLAVAEPNDRMCTATGRV